MSDETGAIYLREVLRALRQYKDLGEGALAQVPADRLGVALDAEANSLAVLVQHLAGNMRSRFTDFLTTDGEKPDRNRDAEFEHAANATPEEVRARWDAGWRVVFAAVEPLRPADLERRVTIRGEPLSVLEALNRALAHYSYHVGQIVLLAKHLREGEWQTLSIPRKR
ncbi:MAG TPA: DUF1572 family protein [Gemmatimonadales bacterium]|nr:DUF1572 family protein [Gemmatimonadales bacterium]